MRTNKRSLITGMIAFVLTVVMLSGILAGCGSQASGKTTVVKIGTTSDEPRIWEAVEKKLRQDKNIQIKIVNFANGANPNQALADGEVDLNAFQHYAYLEKQKKDFGFDLTVIGDTLIVPLNLFSKKFKSVQELPAGARIAIPNDVVNEGRALNVLQNAGLIKLKAGAGRTPSLKDIAENPRQIQFVELVGAQIPRSLLDVDAAIINCGFAVDAGLDPLKDPLYKDRIDLNDPNQQPYINTIVARTKDKDNPLYQEIVKAYQSEEVAQLIQKVFKGAAIPAWDKKYSSSN